MLGTKDRIAGFLGSRWLAWLRQALTRNRLCIFTLHRFATEQSAEVGMPLEDLRAILERLRREGYRLVALEQGVRDLLSGDMALSGTVAVTIDDGYADVADAADVLLSFDCPATVFLSTELVSGNAWHWWDQISFICSTTVRATLVVSLGRERLTIPLATREERRRVVRQIWERCKHTVDAEKWRFIRNLAAMAEVDLPRQAPSQYAGLTWDQVRALEGRGLRFGPHGRTHPILSQLNGPEAECEIVGSWQAVQANTASPVPIFAYPNGRPWDFGDREVDTLRRLDMLAAVTTMPGLASARALRQYEAARFQLPRLGLRAGPGRACFLASGGWRLTHHLRTEQRSSTSQTPHENRGQWLELQRG